MYDSVTVANIPTDAVAVAGYINGDYAWSGADWARFPMAKKVRIQVFIPGHRVYNDGDVLDIEANDTSRDEAITAMNMWVGMRAASGIIPSIYTSRSTQSVLSRKLVNTGVDWWLADYTGSPHTLPKASAVQYADKGPYDVSVIADDWPRVRKDIQVAQVTVMSSDVVDALQVNGAWYELQPDGGIRVTDGLGNPVDNIPFQDYNILANDGHRFYFGAGKNGGVFSYPGLPAGERQGSRYFTRIFLG